ncbi:MAG: hypothetical protein FWG43_02530 [Clostridiales bacterium]|nr:hypothetical protein [Clostridiales bacterium]
MNICLSIMPGTAAPSANPPISAAEAPWLQTVVPAQLLVGLETPTSPVSTSLFPSIGIELVRVDLREITAKKSSNSL